jgi:uncharacterized RDD family membrane protein YckC
MRKKAWPTCAPLWTARHQGLHDLLAGTLVLNGRAADAGTAPASTTGGNTFSA